MVDSSKYLGVTVGEDLSWTKHISEAASKANHSLGFLRWNFKICSRQVKATTYTSAVRLVLEYASLAWDPHRQTDIRTLETVQRPTARYVNNDYTTRTSGCVTDMIKGLGWENLEDRRCVARHSLGQVFHIGCAHIPQDQ